MCLVFRGTVVKFWSQLAAIPPGGSSKPTRYVSNFKKEGKECNIQKLLNGIQKPLNDIQNMIC